jgi:hypothetical protein
MAAGSIAAGLVDGYVRGMGLRRQMNREEEDRKDREELRARRRQQQAEEDSINAALRGVKRDVSSYGPSPEDSDLYGPDAGALRQVQRSQRDILADQARAVAGIGGLRGAQLGLQFQQGVDQLDEVQRQRRRQDAADVRQAGLDRENAADRESRRAREAIADRQMRVLEGLRNARLLASTAGNDPQRLAGVAQAMSTMYEGVPDGRKLLVNNGTMGVAGADAKWIFPPVPITRENVNAALDYAERYLDPNWATRQQADTNDLYRRGLLKNAGRDQDRQDRQLKAQIDGGYFNQKLVGAASRNTEDEDGTVTVQDRNGKPQFNIISGGQQVDLGITNTSWKKAQREAATAGVRAAIGKDKTGRDVIGFIGADGKPYTTAAEAARARAPR